METQKLVSNYKYKKVLNEDICPLLCEPRKITSSYNSYRFILPEYLKQGDMDLLERCYAVYVNRANEPIGFTLISQGGTCGTVIDPKLVIRMAFELMAHGIILYHNHPSGSLKPSEEDRKITTKIKEACKLCDLALLDHLIVTEEGYYSFADEEIL